MAFLNDNAEAYGVAHDECINSLKSAFECAGGVVNDAVLDAIKNAQEKMTTVYKETDPVNSTMSASNISEGMETDEVFHYVIVREKFWADEPQKIADTLKRQMG
jgi:hypothetical protein